MGEGPGIRRSSAGCWLMWPSGRRSLEDVDRAGAGQPDHVRQADLRALDLPVAGLAAQVRTHLEDVRDAGRAERVALGQQAAGHVDRDLTVAPRAAPVDPLPGAALWAQPQVVVVPQLGGGEAV